MPNEILIPLQSLVSCSLEPPTNRQVAGGTTEGLWRGYSSACPKGAVCWAPVAVTQAGGGSSVLTLLCAKGQSNENCEHRSDIWQIFRQAMKGIPWHVFPTAFSSCPSALSRDSSSAKTNETQALMSYCKKFIERQRDK